MKREHYLRRMLSGGLLQLLLAGGLLASCTQDEQLSGSSTPFAAGEHPVVLTGAVETATRATADDTWSGGEQVAVEAAPNTAGAQPEVKTYTADGDGRLTSDAPFWWTNSAEKKTLRAWYCGDGSSASGKENAASIPVEWTVQPDQSGIVSLPNGDGTDGYQASDLLFAPATEAAFAGDAAVPLRFYHQTAKVVVNIKKAEYVTDASKIKAVRVGDGNLVLTAGFTAPADGSSAGIWATDEAEAAGTVIPRKLAAPSDAEKYVASYEALVIPQPTAGKRMVAVQTDFGTMYYTTPGDARPLAAGKVRTYNITVYADRLEVSVANGEDGAWTDGGSEEVTSKYLVTSYTAEDLKIGDYFYSDGTTSDGGLRERWSDGSLKIADPKPAPETGGNITVVGIVFQTVPSRIGQDEKDALKAKDINEPHGLVMSVKNAGTTLKWSNVFETTGATVCTTVADCYLDISGLKNTQAVYEFESYTNDADKSPAFKAVADFNTNNAVPENATKWFMPSEGQLWDLLENLGKVEALKAQRTNGSTRLHSYDNGDVCSNLNSWLTDITGADLFDGVYNYFWSSSEYSGDYARFWYVNSKGSVYCNWRSKGNGYDVRPVLAF